MVVVKSGVAKTGARHITYLRCSKGLVSYGVQKNAYFSSNVVRGATIFP